MTVADLIAELLLLIRNHFYADRVREYMRDERALMKAIARYGYECERRHWQFQVDHIRRDIAEVLRSMREKQAAIQYLPVYLEGAIDRHIRLHAEELSRAAKDITKVTRRAVNTVASVAVVEKTAVETLAALYTDLKRQRRCRRPAKILKDSPPVQTAQPALL